MANKELSYDEFLCITLLYAGNVGEDFTNEERSAIVRHVGQETYDKVFSTFDEMSDFEALETIMAHKGLHFPTPARKQELLSKIESIFKSDDEYDPVEKEIYRFLSNLL